LGLKIFLALFILLCDIFGLTFYGLFECDNLWDFVYFWNILAGFFSFLPVNVAVRRAHPLFALKLCLGVFFGLFDFCLVKQF
jgi:hypothetical protein